MLAKFADTIGRLQRDRRAALSSVGEATVVAAVVAGPLDSGESDPGESGRWLSAGAAREQVAAAASSAAPVDWLPAELASSPTASAEVSPPAPADWALPAVHDTAGDTAEWTGEIASLGQSDGAEIRDAATRPRLLTARVGLLRFGLPTLVVASSLVVVLAIAGVFGSSSRPAAARLTAPSHAPAATTPVSASTAPAKPNTTATSPQRRAPARHHAVARHAVVPVQPAQSTPANRPPASSPQKPPAVEPSPVHHVALPSHGAPTPHNTPTPQQINTTRPTQRSGAPGRQAIGG